MSNTFGINRYAYAVTTGHPDGLFCPICGCGSIHYWPELTEWNTWDDKTKKKYEVCPCCDYDSNDFPYEDF